MKNLKTVILTGSGYITKRIRDTMKENKYNERFIYAPSSGQDFETVLKMGIDLLIIKDSPEIKVSDTVIKYRDLLYDTQVLFLYDIQYSDNPEKLKELELLGVNRFISSMFQPFDLIKEISTIEGKKEWNSLPVLLSDEIDIDISTDDDGFNIVDSDDMDDVSNYQDNLLYKKEKRKTSSKKSVLDEYEETPDLNMELIIPKLEIDKIERIKSDEKEDDDSLGVDDFFIQIDPKKDDEKKEEKKETIFNKIISIFDKF